MSFVSQGHEFLVFFAIVLSAYSIAGRYLSASAGHRVQNLLLVSASYIFYGWWDVRLLLLIVISTVVDFCAGLMIERGELTRRQRCWSTLALPLAAVCFIGLDWDAVCAADSISDGLAAVFENAPLASGGGLAQWIVGGTLLAVLAGNLLYPILTSLSERTCRRVFLVASVVANLGILGLFKYFNFFAESLVELAGVAGVTLDTPTLEVLLPVGISFYTFQTMGYTIDVYRGRVKPVDRFSDFMLYVCFFPQLVMGPIERAAQLLPQIDSPRKVRLDQLTSGTLLAVWGYFKKAVIADNVAVIVDQTFSDPSPPGSMVVLATYAFAIQIYCDFSGYTDIGRGVARMLGIELRLNFRLPYFATTPGDFWQRWHISLSSWLRDYLYIPLGGNRHGERTMYRNLILTMLLGGLWHGAAWNFVLWGAYHGLLLILFRVLATPADRHELAEDVTSRRRAGVKFWLKVFLFFQLTCVGWLLFRSASLEQLNHFAWAMFANPGLESVTLRDLVTISACSLPLLIVQLIQHSRDDQEFWTNWPLVAQVAAGLVVYYGIIFLQAPRTYPFIYFQF
jgi:alginate O-acetyltransferase complex protein AlgI